MPQNFSAQTNYKYANLTGAATAVVKAAPGVLRRIYVNLTNVGTVTLFDNASAASGTKIATISASTVNQVWIYDTVLVNGLTVVTTGTPDLTVVYT